MKTILHKQRIYLSSIIGVLLSLITVAQAQTGNIDPHNKSAWGTNIGWVDFLPTNGGIMVYIDHLEGYAYAENVGWIRLGTHMVGGEHTYSNTSNMDYGVNNDGSGNLSGYAWSTNTGWINFNPTHGGVTVDMVPSGEFHGYVWSENVGWINFNNSIGVTYKVATTENNALPVELTSFKANTDNGIVILTWQTATEVNNYGFEIECAINLRGLEEKNGNQNIKGLDDENGNQNLGGFSTLGFVEGHGNSNSPKQYSYTDKPTGGSKFQYRLKQIDIDGGFEYFPNAFGIEVELEFPTKYKLAQNYPNPFNPSTVIQYSIPTVISNRASSEREKSLGDSSPQKSGIRNDNVNVTLKIYDILGCEVATLVNQKQNPGNYEVTFNAGNLVSGMYIYQLTAGDFREIKKLMLMK
jgi:hypothetical protein